MNRSSRAQGLFGRRPGWLGGGKDGGRPRSSRLWSPGPRPRRDLGGRSENLGRSLWGFQDGFREENFLRVTLFLGGSCLHHYFLLSSGFFLYFGRFLDSEDKSLLRLFGCWLSMDYVVVLR